MSDGLNDTFSGKYFNKEENMSKKCIKCGGEIPEGRLKALPNTNVCVNCSNTGIKKALVTTGGYGDHTWNDIQIVDEKTYERCIQYEEDYYKKIK